MSFGAILNKRLCQHQQQFRPHWAIVLPQLQSYIETHCSWRWSGDGSPYPWLLKRALCTLVHIKGNNKTQYLIGMPLPHCHDKRLGVKHFKLRIQIRRCCKHPQTVVWYKPHVAQWRAEPQISPPAHLQTQTVGHFSQPAQQQLI